ncbi:hypothetical protein L1987_64213 [Smallanthus sonchifolius]|uniref:Uncharacterized protein n=1 Tax=Smallanthus sonchifolius TaxID=185202 RepID=A0ACB9CFE2_9ASTR|nr:hypothetical protein L1987_64213 [Smallanthus sonchifolius]
MVMVTLRLMKLERGDDGQLPPLVVVEPPPITVGESQSHRSIETLVVVLAVITIVALIAGFIARLCGGRHYGGSGGDHEFEGWIESRCRSCLDPGVSSAPPPPPPPTVAPPETKEEAKK